MVVPKKPSTADKFPENSVFFGDIVKICVGNSPNARTYDVHKGALCYYSSYFDAALNGEFAEAGDGVVKLPTEDPETFDLFTGWVYTRRLLEHRPEESEAQFATQHVPLLKLWVFADAHQIPLLQNEIIDKIHRHIFTVWTVSIHGLYYVYEHTTNESKLRKFLSYTLAVIGSAEKQLRPNDELHWPPEALRDVMRIVWTAKRPQRISQTEYKKLDTCQYHVHEEGVKCSPAEADKQ